VKRFFNALVRVISINIINILYKILFKVKYSKSKKNVFIYSDSRGFLVDCFFCNRTPHFSYIEILSRKYNIDYKICPHKHTTTLDAIKYLSKLDIKRYDYIILHIGIVDYSPRPLSQYEIVYNKKNNLRNEIFPNIEMKPNIYDIQYENDVTFSLYNFSFLKIILDHINDISQDVNIVWIGMNKVDLEWNGNYFKKRPLNINKIMEYQEEIEKYIANNKSNIDYINLEKIVNFDYKIHTLDNMHFSKVGFTFLSDILLSKLK
jgi:hypothetical protein